LHVPASLYSFNLNCEYLDTTCGAGGRTCGKPVIALSPADGGVLSAAACVKDFERDGIALGDTCISVDLVRMDSFCDCTVTFDTKFAIRAPSVVKDEASRWTAGMSMRKQSRQSVEINFDLSLNGDGESIVGFLPSFQGLCSKLKPESMTGSAVTAATRWWYL
jgi:hypothetical protein